MHDEASACRFQLAGRLSKVSIGDLEQAWLTACSMTAGKCVIVDVTQLTGIDAAGRDLLVTLCRSGARLVAAGQHAARRQLMIGQEVTIQATGTGGRIRCRTPTVPVPATAFLMCLVTANAARLKT